MDNVTSILGTQLLDKIQFGFIEHINAKFSALQSSAVTLLAVVAALELAIFGLVWVIKQDEGVGNLIVKFIKIGFFFVIIQYFPALLQFVLEIFIKVGYIVSPEKSKALLFSPGKVWVIGFKAGVSMLKVSVQYGTFNIGLSMLYLVLGMGLLLIFAAIGAQIIISVVLFYFVAVLSLIIIPLGVLKPLQDLFNRAIQSLLRAGVRLFAVILILGVAFTLFQSLKITSITDSTSLEKPLALFFTSFVLLILLYTLPSYLARAVGKPGGNLFENVSSPHASNVVVNQPPAYVNPNVSSVQAGSSMQSTQSAANNTVSMQAASTVVSGSQSVSTPAQAANINVSTTVHGGGGGKQEKVSDASNINRSISDSTIKKVVDKE
ncbi:type IV secretion system protein [Fangia hongkongensis]|uniref:type IV secretion system protein n=1 Tax=Fangia hongkongensis TaxID=270495 RepID=UPI00036C72D4|nr:type IV secretion system protein [Fangia hongkongensis]MBK2126202.1 type IV secretion system protein [Fangia hongkongensis]